MMPDCHHPIYASFLAVAVVVSYNSVCLSEFAFEIAK
jgi:hypothetical protein